MSNTVHFGLYKQSLENILVKSYDRTEDYSLAPTAAPVAGLGNTLWIIKQNLHQM